MLLKGDSKKRVLNSVSRRFDHLPYVTVNEGSVELVRHALREVSNL